MERAPQNKPFHHQDNYHLNTNKWPLYQIWVVLYFFLCDTIWEYLPHCFPSLIFEKVKQLLLALLDFGQVVTFQKWHSRCLRIFSVYPWDTKAHSSCRTPECDRDVHADREGVERGGTEWSRTAGGMSEGLFWSPIILHFVLDLLESSCLNKYTLLWLSRFPRHPPPTPPRFLPLVRPPSSLYPETP